MAKRRKSRGRKRRPGRAFELLASAVLLLVILVFAISIAARYGDPSPATHRPVGWTPPRTADRPARVPERDRPSVDIRNGCGRTGLAEEMTEEVRRAGFDVVEYRNADRYDYRATLIRDRTDRPGAADRLSAWLRAAYGVGQVVREPKENPGVDLVLVLGADLADTLEAREERAAAR